MMIEALIYSRSTITVAEPEEAQKPKSAMDRGKARSHWVKKPPKNLLKATSHALGHGWPVVASGSLVVGKSTWVKPTVAAGLRPNARRSWAA